MDHRIGYSTRMVVAPLLTSAKPSGLAGEPFSATLPKWPRPNMKLRWKSERTRHKQLEKTSKLMQTIRKKRRDNMKRSLYSLITLFIFLYSLPPSSSAISEKFKSETAVPQSMIEKVGEYHLGQELSTVRGLTEFTTEEYAAFQTVPGWFNMPGEKIYNAPKVIFNKSQWDLTIGALDGKIYAMALQHFGRDHASADNVFKKTIAFASSKMGVPSEKTYKPKRFKWETSGGDALLAERTALGYWSVNFILTANPESFGYLRKERDSGRMGSLKDLDTQNGFGGIHFGDSLPHGMVYKTKVPDPAGEIEIYSSPNNEEKLDGALLGAGYYGFRGSHLVNVQFFAPSDPVNAEALMKAFRNRFGQPTPITSRSKAFTWEGAKVVLTVALDETPIFIEFHSKSDIKKIIKALDR